MKGPGLRIDNDVRRVWRCPCCGQIHKAGGEVVAKRCGCRPDGPFLQLQEGIRRVRQFEIHAVAAKAFAVRNESVSPVESSSDSPSGAAPVELPSTPPLADLPAAAFEGETSTSNPEAGGDLPSSPE